MYQIFTDGSSSKKSKTIGTSYVIFKDKNIDKSIDFSKGFIDEQARNGIAELLGVYFFLHNICTEEISLNKSEEICIYSDSQYVVNEFTIWFRNQMMKNFYDTKNKEVIIYVLWMLYILRKEGYKIRFEWVRGHQKVETFEAYGNNSADALAVSCHKYVSQDKKDNMQDIEEFEKNLKQEIKIEGIFESIKKAYLNI